MNKKEIIEAIKELSLEDVSSVLGICKDIYEDKYKKTYTEVYIYPGERIEDKIHEETGFYCYHKPVEQEYSAARGTHVIVIPKEQYTKELEQNLVKKYDDNWD